MTETDAFTKVGPHTPSDLTGRKEANERIIYVPAFGGDFNPGVHKQSRRNFANPAPLGLCAFACTLFVLSLINAQTRGVLLPNIAVGLAFAYGGLVQLLAGMWEMAVGNTFGATALTSYAGFWLSYAIMLTNDLFGVFTAYGLDQAQLYNAIGLYIVGWFIFTTIMLICTLRSTVAFFALFLCIDVTFILMANSYFKLAKGEDNHDINKAAGVIGCIASFLAWWCALAGILDSTNSFFKLPVLHFPWSIKPEEVNKKKGI
jgi:succinate-acetate transporter protein